MTTLTNSYHILIDATAEKIFAYVSDLTRHSEWSGGPLKVEAASSGPVAAGSRYISVGDLPMQKNRRNELRVTELQRPSRLAFVAKDPGLGEITHEFNFTPQGSSTLVTRRVTVNAPPLMAFMLQTFVHPLVDKPMMDKALSALKAKMESGGRVRARTAPRHGNLMVILTLGFPVLIGGVLGIVGLRRYSLSHGTHGKLLIALGALLCLVSVGFYLFMIALVASGT